MRSIAIVKARVLGVGLICELDSGQYRFRPDNIAVSISVANYHFSIGLLAPPDNLCNSTPNFMFRGVLPCF